MRSLRQRNAQFPFGARDNSGQPASRWYTGAGIYRHVRLVVTDPVPLRQMGTFITTPRISESTPSCGSGFRCKPGGESKRCEVEIRIVSPTGTAAGFAKRCSATSSPAEQPIFGRVERAESRTLAAGSLPHFMKSGS